MQRPLSFFLTVLLLRSAASFAVVSETPMLDAVVVGETTVPSETFRYEIFGTEETTVPSETFRYEIFGTEETLTDEDEDIVEVPSTHVPHLMSSPLNMEATEGETVVLPCNVDDLGDFVLLWTLEKDRKTQLLYAGALEILRNPRMHLNGTSLHLRNLRPSDSGVYICQISTNPPMQLNHTLDVLYPPSVEAYPKDALITAKEGESVMLTCHAKGNPPPTVTWKHAGRHYESNKESKYLINNAQKENSGEYECIADNGIGDPAYAVITVEIVSAPKVSTDPENGLLVVKEGEPITIGCKAIGDPMPVITWKKPNMQKLVTVHEGNKISIEKASLNDAGAYECIANNSLGIFTSALIRVQVLYAPKVHMSHIRIHAREGVKVNITCVAEGEPSPTITWKKEDRTTALPSEHHDLRGNSYSLIFHHLKEEDFGLYECIASNSLSSASGTTLLIGTPQMPIFTSKPHGTQGTKYTISWTVDSHTPIDEYSLMYRKLRQEEWQTQPVPATAPKEGAMHMQVYQLSELEPATEYEAVVKARNKFGWSDPSEVLFFTTKNEEKYSDTLASCSSMLSISFSILFLFLVIGIKYSH